MFKAAILAYKQKVKIFEMDPNQFLLYMNKASFVQNSKPLPYLIFTRIREAIVAGTH